MGYGGKLDFEYHFRSCDKWIVILGILGNHEGTYSHGLFMGLMRSFDGNLNAYHSLNALNDIYVKHMSKRLTEASTQEEQDAIMQDSDMHFAEQGKLYQELGEEMVKIMDVKL